MRNYLKEFQLANRLAPDGIVGKMTASVMMKHLGITSKVEFSHFIAQCQHESAGFTAGRENLNYSFIALLKKFGKYFGLGEIAGYARSPEKIANRIYAHRMGNGNEASGDGWKYRGAGALQLTGKKNIQAYFESVGLPAYSDPTIILEPDHYFKSGKWFFDANNVWKNCGTGKDCAVKVSKHVQYGTPETHLTPLGLGDRIEFTGDMIKRLTQA